MGSPYPDERLLDLYQRAAEWAETTYNTEHARRRNYTFLGRRNQPDGTQLTPGQRETIVRNYVRLRDSGKSHWQARDDVRTQLKEEISGSATITIIFLALRLIAMLWWHYRPR